MAALRNEAVSAATGAVVTFSGDVRNHDGGREVISLDYEAHPSASEVLAVVAAEIVSEYPLQALIIEHRYGSLAIGDTALGVAAASAHRKDAFAACSAAVDRVKEKLPMWKHQFFKDGTDEWVNSA
jgi:molybdopterin synthase catalytic subunit